MPVLLCQSILKSSMFPVIHWSRSWLRRTRRGSGIVVSQSSINWGEIMASVERKISQKPFLMQRGDAEDQRGAQLLHRDLHGVKERRGSHRVQDVEPVLPGLPTVRHFLTCPPALSWDQAPAGLWTISKARLWAVVSSGFYCCYWFQNST